MRLLLLDCRDGKAFFLPPAPPEQADPTETRTEEWQSGREWGCMVRLRTNCSSLPPSRPSLKVQSNVIAIATGTMKDVNAIDDR